MSSLVSRMRYEIHRHGVKATAGKAAQGVRKKVYIDQTFVWYELPLGAERPRVSLPPEFALVRGGASEIPLLDELPTSGNEWLARRWMEAGNDLWLVLEERRPAFACWIFHGSTPVRAARDGWFALAPGIVCFEDSATSASYRGRGVAPAAWSQIADRLEQTAARSIITKIEESNTASRRAIVKSGFREIATMHFRRVGLRERTAVLGTGETAGWLAGQLQR
jgi:RimJ/RimL family protein N-acetyltransferase